jgi:hypothetical protein
MIRTATELRKLAANSYASITSELCVGANSLLQKEQQVEAHLLCSHMFNVSHEAQGHTAEEEEEVDESMGSPDKVKNCLVRALKAASTMMDVIDRLPWYYKVLGHAIYHLENGVELPPEWFNALTAKIDQEHEEHTKEIELKLSKANRQFYVSLIRHKSEVIHFD